MLVKKTSALPETGVVLYLFLSLDIKDENLCYFRNVFTTPSPLVADYCRRTNNIRNTLKTFPSLCTEINFSQFKIRLWVVHKTTSISTYTLIHCKLCVQQAGGNMTLCYTRFFGWKHWFTTRFIQNLFLGIAGSLISVPFLGTILYVNRIVCNLQSSKFYTHLPYGHFERSLLQKTPYILH